MDKCIFCCTKFAIFATFAHYPPKWQADVTELSAELTFLTGGKLGCIRQCGGWLPCGRRCIFGCAMLAAIREYAAIRPKERFNRRAYKAN